MSRRFFALAPLLAALAAASAFSSPAPAADLDIVAFGDSLTVGVYDAGDDSCDDPNVGYPPRLASRLRQRGHTVEMVNAGECGETTSGGLSRIDEVIDDNPDADLVIILEGTNDLSQTISVESMRFNIARMTHKVLNAKMRPVVASPPPREPVRWGSNARGAFLSSKLEEDAVLTRLDFADQFDRFDFAGVFDEHYDSDGLHLNASGYAYLAEGFLQPTLDAIAKLGPKPCVDDDETICLTDDLFAVSVSWRDPAGATGTGKAGRITSDTGHFWFFSAENIELVIKVLDGREINDRFWVFYGALSNVEYTISIRDTRTGHQRIYFNKQRDQASVSDTDAFPGELAASP